MDNQTFEQYTLAADVCGDPMRFLKEGSQVGLLFWNDQLIGMTPPKQVTLEVTYAEPAAKGNTATNVTKAATVETNTEVQVPAFISEGEKIKIEVETGNYAGRVND